MSFSTPNKTKNDNFLITSLIILYLNYAASQEQFNALFFDRRSRSLIEVPNVIPKSAPYDDWAAACPASSDNDQDEQFNQEESFCKNALFVRSICDKYDDRTLQVKICDKPFKLSIAMHEKRPSLFYFEFGYEIYTNPWDSKKFKLSDKEIYRRLPDINYQKPFEFFPSSSDTKGFIWIPLFEMKTFEGRLFKIRYEIHKNNRRSSVKCQDYSLGKKKEIFKGIDIDTLYIRDVQKKALEGFNIPKRVRACAGHCFEKWLLIPADQFQFGSSVPPTCSNMVTIPIWSSFVKELLQNLDEYLYALSKVLNRPLYIDAGVGKNLSYPSKILRHKKLVALKNNGITIFVPKIIYKLVKVKLHNCNNNTGCWYGVVIVIHNNPMFKTARRICKNKTEDLGWEDITYTSTSSDSDNGSSKYIYVCPISHKILKYLGLKIDKRVSVRILSLKTTFSVGLEFLQNEAEPDGITLKELVSHELTQRFQANEDELESERIEEIERPLFSDSGFPH